jgi:AcrR family transcriptional regulator
MSTLSHNLVGQRLGRKGRETRERILAATERLLAGSRDTAISLSAVAREASLAMTTLYLYFNDLTELLLAVLEPIIASAEGSYLAHLRAAWPDDSLGEHCLNFVEAYHDFWVRHSRILHLRNSFADSNDERMRQHRIDASRPLIELIIIQIEDDPTVGLSPAAGMATVLVTSVERIITMATDPWVLESQIAMATGEWAAHSQNWNPALHTRYRLQAVARLLELGINDGRRASRAGTGPRPTAAQVFTEPA